MNQRDKDAPPRKHAILTCYDDRLNPTLSQYKASVNRDGNIFVPSVRPVGGIHAMTHGKCSKFFCKQIHGVIEIAGADCIDLFVHTDCQFNQLFNQPKVETFEQEVAFQIATLKKVHAGALQYITTHFPRREIRLDTRMILTKEQRIITIEEAGNLFRNHHPHRHGASSSCHHTPEQRSLT